MPQKAADAEDQAPHPPTREPVVKPAPSPSPTRDCDVRGLQSGWALELKGKTSSGDSHVQPSLGTTLL